MERNNLSINKSGNLTVGGVDTCLLAKEYSTPLYVLDEDIIKRNAKVFVNALEKYASPGSLAFYASKALSFVEIYKIVSAAGMGSDLVSSGEIYTAVKAGFDMSNTIFHGNNKTDFDIEYGIKNKVGFFAVDNLEELSSLDRIAGYLGVKQDILLRLTPGVDAHTHEAVATGKVDSKFGFAMFTADAKNAAKTAAGLKNVRIRGYHCHIGSQISEIEPFLKTVDIMLDFIKDTDIKTDILNIGGGFGVAYLAHDPALNVDSAIKAICGRIKEKSRENNISEPILFLEPGRAIVANAGLTLYTVGSVKRLPGVKNYVSIDGGMADNPRYALYKSPYTCVIANKMEEDGDFLCSVAGRCCESGDLIQEDVLLPKPTRGDILAVLDTGAYNFSMASNYNRLPRPAVVIVSGGAPRVAVRRESLEHLTCNDV
ncbi:MAG: diaminopimelate decarboxylase [Eubacteriales bacterium]